MKNANLKAKLELLKNMYLDAAVYVLRFMERYDELEKYIKTFEKDI